MHPWRENAIGAWADEVFDLDYYKKGQILIGTDEVGRGPLAGPVASCACLIKDQIPQIIDEIKTNYSEITDSKNLDHASRKDILKRLGITPSSLKPGYYFEIHFNSGSVFFSLGQVGVAEIEKINILQAALKSMRRSIENLPIEGLFGKILIDGNKKINFYSEMFEEIPIVKGDSKVYLIALSSIIAKEYRDRLMQNYAKKYIGYGFETNSGYPTPRHRQAIIEQGITPIHRKTFKGVKEFL